MRPCFFVINVNAKITEIDAALQNMFVLLYDVFSYLV